MKVSFYLKRPDSKTETAIFARIYYGLPTPLKYYLPEAINPANWNSDTHRARETKKFPVYPEFNARLNNIEAIILNTIRKYINDNCVIPAHDTIRPYLDAAVKNIETPKPKQSLITLFDEIINHSKDGIRTNKQGKPIALGTVRYYETAKARFAGFEKYRGKPITFDEIDLNFYNKFIEYLTKELKLSTNTIGKQIQTLKLILNTALDNKLTDNTSFKSDSFRAISEDTDAIYLDVDELKEIEQLELSGDKRLENARDLFLMGCYTGLRFSDFSILNPQHIKGGFIKIKQVKTNKDVVIPVHDTVTKIIDKYGGNMPRAISNQKLNEYIKDVAKKTTLAKKTFDLNFTKAGVVVKQTCKRSELIGTHTARRSFATNEYLAGTPTITIMAITGHKTEKAFLKYIRVTPTEHAKLMQTLWGKRTKV